ncbi:ferrochelatase [bacterium BMS3Abin10]|nr:ferrochelatase [bacterium BMS3Abin10]GBE38500.1 ferrochelatase [bacterium BMS3Bbin08]
MRENNGKSIGVVLLNLGGPDSLSSVRPFLYNLFSDRGIIRLGPSFLQKSIAWLISGYRSKKSEEMYSLIGGKSPIFEITTAQAEALEKALNTEVEKIGSLEDKISSTSQPLNFLTSSFKVYVGMRYWYPYISDTVDKIRSDGIEQVVVLSLYPHYSKATTGSSVAEFKRVISRFTIPSKQPAGRHDSRFTVKYIDQWYDFPLYIDALSDRIAEGMSKFKGKTFDILYSAHSLPESFIKQGDPYLDHIKSTIKAVNPSIGKWHLSFQSRSGPVKWLQPDTEETIIRLAKGGVKNLLVVPISFVSDHIETLYEIDIYYKKIAKSYGINLKRCESLNLSEKFINALKELVLEKLKESE